MLNIVASFFRFTIPSSIMMFYIEKQERNKNVFPSMVIIFLYFLQTIHRAAIAG